MTTETPIEQGGETLKVRAPITDPGEGGPRFESMHARHDPAAADQAVLVNAPFFCDYLNFGDLVRVGPACDGLSPILEVVAASGHRRVMAFTGDTEAGDLLDHIVDLYPEHALKMEGSSSGTDQMVSVSVHPDFDPEQVADDLADWFDDNGGQGTAAISPVIETVVGPVEWPDD